MTRERLYLFDTTLRDGAQTQRRRFHARRQARDRRACSTISASTMSRAAIPAPIRPTPQLFAEERKLDTTFTAFGMTRRPGRSASNDPGLAALLDAKADAICFVAKSWDYHVRVALETTTRKTSPRSATACAPPRPRAARCCSTASISSTATRPIRHYALACAKAAYDDGARWVVLCDTNGGTLPHEVEAIVGEVVQGHSRRPCRHPRPQRHRAGGGQLARRGARRRAPDPGHAQRPRRALRQRQSRLDHPDAEAEAGVRRAASRSASRTTSSRALAARLAHARRAAQPRAEPPRALCRRERLRHQGRHPCLGDREGAGDLRARAAGSGRQPPQAPGVRSGAAARTSWPSSSASASRSTRTIRASPACSTRSRSARRSAMPMRPPTRRSSCWRGASSAQVPDYFDVEQFDVNVEQRINAHRQARDRLDGGGQGEGRRRDADLGGRGQRPGQRARPRAAQGSRQVPELHRRAGAHRLPRAYPQWRHRGGHPRADREPGRDRRALDHGRRLAQHHRRLVPGADGFDRLQAGAARARRRNSKRRRRGFGHVSLHAPRVLSRSLAAVLRSQRAPRRAPPSSIASSSPRRSR